MQHAHVSSPLGLGDQYDAIAASLSAADRELACDLSQPLVSDRTELVEARILQTRLASYRTDKGDLAGLKPTEH